MPQPRRAPGDLAVSPGLAIREGRHGRGVFAARAFEEGDEVEVCPTLELPDPEVTGVLGDYVFGSGREGFVLLLLGFGMLYNHSADPNVHYVEGEGTSIAFITLRPVAEGDELRIDYGAEWWETRGLTPE